ncbi:MAG: DUF86 domain-containing protein [Firmicutes bacterium]|nr:DUF86 domain-containing protein [Bacillota bacterium]
MHLYIKRLREAAIALAMHVVAEKNLGLPQSSRQAFELLYENGFIDRDLSERLKAMARFS